MRVWPSNHGNLVIRAMTTEHIRAALNHMMAINRNTTMREIPRGNVATTGDLAAELWHRCGDDRFAERCYSMDLEDERAVAVEMTDRALAGAPCRSCKAHHVVWVYRWTKDGTTTTPEWDALEAYERRLEAAFAGR